MNEKKEQQHLWKDSKWQQTHWIRFEYLDIQSPHHLFVVVAQTWERINQQKRRQCRYDENTKNEWQRKKKKKITNKIRSFCLVLTRKRQNYWILWLQTCRKMNSVAILSIVSLHLNHKQTKERKRWFEIVHFWTQIIIYRQKLFSTSCHVYQKPSKCIQSLIKPTNTFDKKYRTHYRRLFCSLKTTSICY